jgi:hypothetical protein
LGDRSQPIRALGREEVTVSDDPVRAELRQRAAAFIESQAFDSYYFRAHLPKSWWIAGQLLRCISLVGLRGGLEGLRNTSQQLFDSSALRQRYRELPAQGVVARVFILINHPALDTGAVIAAPALAVPDLEGSAAGDASAEAVWDHIVNRVLIEESQAPVDQALAKMIADEEYVATRKRKVPAGLAGVRDVVLLDVRIDTRLIGGSLLGAAGRGSSKLYFLVDPRPQGLSFLIPTVDLPLSAWRGQPERSSDPTSGRT